MIIKEILYILGDSQTLSDSELKGKINELLKGKKLHEEISPLKKYRLEAKGKIAKVNSVKFQQYMMYFIFADEVVDMIGESWRQSPDKDKTRYRINATIKLFNKTRQTMLDMLPLFEHGALPSCLVLWRSMYENYVFAKYLLASPDEESDRFNDYATIQNGLMSKEYKAKHSAKIEGLLRKYGKDFSEPFGWITVAKPKSISGVIKHTKEKEFADYYRFTSMQIHASPFSINTSIFHEGEHGNADMLGIFTERIELPFNLVIKLMSRFIEMMIDFFVTDEMMKGMMQVSNRLISAETAMEIPEV